MFKRKKLEVATIECKEGFLDDTINIDQLDQLDRHKLDRIYFLRFFKWKMIVFFFFCISLPPVLLYTSFVLSRSIQRSNKEIKRWISEKDRGVHFEERIYWNSKESWLWQGEGNAFTEVSSWTEGTKFRTGFWVWRTWFYWLSFLLASSRFIFPSPVSIYFLPFTGVGSNCWGISDRPYRNSFSFVFSSCGDLSVKTMYSYWIIFRKRCSDIYITMERYYYFCLYRLFINMKLFFFKYFII